MVLIALLKVIYDKCFLVFPFVMNIKLFKVFYHSYTIVYKKT